MSLHFIIQLQLNDCMEVRGGCINVPLLRFVVLSDAAASASLAQRSAQCTTLKLLAAAQGWCGKPPETEDIIVTAE